MNNSSDDATDFSFAAEEPHCGVCEYVYFHSDWDRTPYCAEWEQAITIRVGDICSLFELRNDLADSRVDADIDVEID